MTLADYAAFPEHSRGRQYDEVPPQGRTDFQRDRDRIIHCTAFRRLVYKTQVFVNHEGDLYRTRLTHSLEVAQIGRSIARALGLNEDLTEAIALAHDLGHTPFGHAGQEALDACMREFGGFEHNLQSLRVVDRLEEKYAEFPGLNLSFETREGILKHCTPERARQLGTLGERFLAGTQPSLEAQLTNVADQIAYTNHDVDDGLRAGLLTIDALRGTTLFRRHFDQVTERYPDIAPRRAIHETVRRMINHLVSDLIDTSRERLAHACPTSIDAVRALREPLIGFSRQVADWNQELKSFMFENLYHHYRVRRMTRKARLVVTELFEILLADPRLMPPEHARHAEAAVEGDPATARARAVADYIAGMTDRYAITEHARLCDPTERS